MQATVRKCLTDLDQGQSLNPHSLDTFSREIESKNKFILDWQIQNKKITEIENKLKDKEYYNFIKFQADAEIDQLNREFQIKKQMQEKYHRELQAQEKFQKEQKKDMWSKMTEREAGIHGRKSNLNTSYPEINRAVASGKSQERLGHFNQNQTLDISQIRASSRLNNLPTTVSLKQPNKLYGT